MSFHKPLVALRLQNLSNNSTGWSLGTGDGNEESKSPEVPGELLIRMMAQCPPKHNS